MVSLAVTSKSLKRIVLFISRYALRLAASYGFVYAPKYKAFKNSNMSESTCFHSVNSTLRHFDCDMFGHCLSPKNPRT